MLTELLADGSDSGVRARADGLRRAASEIRDLLQSFVRLIRLRTGWFETRPIEATGASIVRSIQAGAEAAGLDVDPADEPIASCLDLDYLRDAVELCADWAVGRSASATLEVRSDAGSITCTFRSSGGRPIPWHEPAILDPMDHGDLVASRRHGGSALQLALANMLAWRLGGKLTASFEDADDEDIVKLEVPIRGEDPLG